MPLIALTIRVLNRLSQPYLAAELLRSVLHHHGIAVGPAASPVTTDAGVDATAARHCPPSVMWCVDADTGEKRCSQEVCVRVIKSVAAAAVDKERDAAAAPSSRAGSEGCDAAGTTAAGSATTTGVSYFTLEAVRARPHISFCEALWQWERFVECGHACAVEQPDSHLCSSELALLNLKLEDSLLSFVAGLRGVRPALNELPPHLANVLCSDLWADGGTSSRGCWAPHALDGVSTEGRTPTGPTCYTLTHFSAELGDIAYVEALQRAYPTGMPLRWFSQPVHSSGGLAADPVLGDGAAGEQDSFFRFAAPRAPRVAHFYPLKWIAEHCPDHTGRHLCHLAACYGHVAYLAYLVQLLGAQAVLTGRRCAVPAAPQITWGRERYLPGLTAVQCAMAHHQLPVLLWVEERHPFALEEMNSRAVLRALTAAAIAKGDSTSTFDFFLTRSLPPLDTLHACRAARRAAGSTGRSATAPLTRGVQMPELQETGLLRVIFAAAEAGNISVLAWFDSVLSPVDVRQVCDKHGATVLHHCARSGHAATMAALLRTPTVNATADAAVHGAAPPSWAALDPALIDLADNAGRTPAMWCVLGGHQGGRGVAMLETLRVAGSSWPRCRRNGATLFDVAGTRYSRHSKLVKYLKAHMQAA